MNRVCFVTLTIVIFLFSQSLYSQIDTIPTHRTIRISKHKDSTYIKAYTDFYVYYDKPTSDLSYKDYVLQNHQKQYLKSANRELLKIIDAKPKVDTSANFNYTFYFQNNHFTKDIKMRPQETDTVRLLVYVSNKGVVTFIDLTKIVEYDGVEYVFNRSPMKEFKEDVSHRKTENAFKELIKDNWQPPVIKALKTHPSKRKNKYKTSKGYTEGVLTVIYSSIPIDE